VFLAQHKVDGGLYAIKKVRLYKPEDNERIIKEVQFLFKLHNLHIVRYYQSWREFITDPDEIRDLNFTDTESEGEEEKQEVRKPPKKKKDETTIVYADSADEEYFLDDDDL